LAAGGLTSIFLDTALFPLDTQFAFGTLDAYLDVGGIRISLHDVRSVWNLQTDFGAALGGRLDSDFVPTVAKLGELYCDDLLTSTGAFQLDPIDVLRGFPIGCAQLRHAAAVRLDIPRTLVSNDIRAIGDFLDSCGGTVVAKMIHSSAASVNGQAYGPWLFDAQDLDTADGSLTSSPMLFQERIPKTVEYRVYVVGSDVFASAVIAAPSQALAWRHQPASEVRFRPSALPLATMDAILALFRRLRIQFGSVDLIETPEGRMVFLEVNPISYWGFVERASGFPISAAIASLLARA
jgi:glutathione synthase/RimK-type ligase-like ATP-grasp enzyme